MTKEEITAIVQSLSNIAAVIRDADPEDKAEVYQQLGRRLGYQPDKHKVRAEAHIDHENRGVMVRVRGPTRTKSQWVLTTEFLLGRRG